MVQDMHLGKEEKVEKRAGMLPYLVLAAGVVIVLLTHWWATG
jgi:hypothetical protein